jgi:hypothetical protein
VDRSSKQTAAAFAAAALLVLGCGGEETTGFKKGGPPPPKRCLERWNRDEGALSFGRHAYSPGHDSRAGRVFAVKDPKRGLSDACVVVFAAKDSDREYGTLGWFNASRGSGTQTALPQPEWEVIGSLPVETQKQRIELQRSGAERANVALSKDGSLTPL